MSNFQNSRLCFSPEIQPWNETQLCLCGCHISTQGIQICCNGNNYLHEIRGRSVRCLCTAENVRWCLWWRRDLERRHKSAVTAACGECVQKVHLPGKYFRGINRIVKKAPMRNSMQSYSLDDLTSLTCGCGCLHVMFTVIKCIYENLF